MIPEYDSSNGSRYDLDTPHFPFLVKVPNSPVQFWSKELSIWLYDNIGINHEDWEWWWSGDVEGWLFEFKYEEDKVKFILRWL